MEKLKHNNNAEKYQAISLFAGAGGCSLGFQTYGVNILAAYDIWDKAIDTYNFNFAGHKAHQIDLSNCNFEEIRNSLNLKEGELDFIIGGPPCQGFTTAGKRGENDPRNRLLINYAKSLEIFRPRWFVMENVEGMLTTGKGDFIVNCVDRMIQLGYTLFIKKVYMHEYGIPQRRKRVFIVGNREGKMFNYPIAKVSAYGHRYKDGHYTLFDAIFDLENIDLPAINHIRKSENGVKLDRIKALRQGESMKDLPVELQHESFAKRASRRVCDGTPSEKRGGAPSGIKRLIYAEPCLTITGSSTSEFIHPVENRMLTIRECARVQTFPDSFVFCGNDAQQEQQIGNAIPPLFANLLAEQIINCDMHPKHYLPQGLYSYDVTKADAKSPALEATCKRLNQFVINLFSNHE